MSEPNKAKAGLRERHQAKRRERQQRKAEQADRARREGATRPQDIRRTAGRGGTDYGGSGGM
jgi:hypothetical protein